MEHVESKSITKEELESMIKSQEFLDEFKSVEIVEYNFQKDEEILEVILKSNLTKFKVLIEKLE